MSEELVIVDKEDLTAIADAVRESTGSTEEFNVSELRTAAVVALSAGGGGGTAVLDAAKEYTDNKVAELINVTAPAGYGLGQTAKEILDANTAVNNGWYKLTSVNVANAHIPFQYVVIHVTAYSDKYIIQDLYRTNNQNAYMRREMYNGTWGEWEYINPPMTAGIEYRTVERIDSKAVYKKKDSSGQILYRLDGETEWKTQAGLMGAAPAYAKVDATLTAAGWYKVGTIQPAGGDFTTACRIAIGGNYSYDSPPSAIIDVASDYDSLNAVVTVPALKNKQVTKVGFIRSDFKIFDVYVYYAQSSRNNVYIAVDILKGTFTKANLESASVSESNMAKVVEPSVSSFAPSGYGLGVAAYTLPYIADANVSMPTGWYRIDSSTVNGVGASGVMRVDAYSSSTFCQTVYTGAYSSKYPAHFERWYKSGVWDATWSWVDPPMTPGNEYRTTERWDGEPVYAKLINCGAMPNASEKIIGHGVSGMKQPLSVSVTAYKSNWAFTLPSSHTNEASVLLNTNGVQITTTIDRSEYTAYALIKYTKN